MNRLAIAVSTLLFAGAGIAAPSATLSTTNGSVLVNQGKQFVTAQPNQVLAAGDRVMVMEGGNASVKYADGCTQALGSGSLAVITAQSVCASGVNKIAQISPVSAQAVGAQERDCDDDGIPDSKDGDIDGDDVLNADDLVESCKAGATDSNNTGIWIVAGLAAAGAAVLISDGDDETISP